MMSMCRRSQKPTPADGQILTDLEDKRRRRNRTSGLRHLLEIVEINLGLGISGKISTGSCFLGVELQLIIR